MLVWVWVGMEVRLWDGIEVVMLWGLGVGVLDGIGILLKLFDRRIFRGELLLVGVGDVGLSVMYAFLDILQETFYLLGSIFKLLYE